MSFIKVKDPRKREELVRDFIETRKRIKDNFVARKVGESEYKTGLTKLFKPVTETQKATAKEITEAQKATAKEITEGLLPIKEGVEKLPLKLLNQVFPSIDFNKSDITTLGETAVKNLKEYYRKDKADMISGIRDEGGSFKIGSEPVKIEDDDIFINDKRFKGTPGLWKLITNKNIPNISEYTPKDLSNYIEIMSKTNTIRYNYNPLNKRRGGSNYKMNELIKPYVRVYEDDNNNFQELINKHFGFETDEDEDDDPQPSTSGTGLKILPSDPNALIDRFDLLFSSKKAGHTGVINEIVSILDELKRQRVINVNDYKKLNRLIKK